MAEESKKEGWKQE